MILLKATTETLELTTSTTSAIDVSVSYSDITTTTFAPSSQETLITTATTTVICSAPAASTQRQIKLITINNTGVSSNVVTVKKDISATEYDMFGPITLGANELLQYIDGQGWKVFTNSGSIKTSLNQGNSPTSSTLNAVVLGSDVVNNNAIANTIADVTGLSFSVTSGKTYYFEFYIPYTAAATTTGSRWSINGPATSNLVFSSEYSLTATTTTRNANVITYDLPAASNATSAGTTAGNMAQIYGIIKPSADGTVIARFASEVTSSAITALAGSVVYYQELL